MNSRVMGNRFLLMNAPPPRMGTGCTETKMKKQGVSQIELAPRLAVLSNGTVHLKDADQPSAGARSPV